MKRRNLLLGAGALVVLAGTSAVLLWPAGAGARAAKNRPLLERSHAPSVGEAAAPVHIVEFLDPACETCAAFYPLVKEMMRANPGRIRLTVRYAPFHRGSDTVVAMLEASRRQGKFWQALETLLANQRGWVLNHTAKPDLAWPFLAQAGVDVERLRADMRLPEVMQAVAQDVQDANTLEVSATPEYFVNGRPLPSFGREQLVQLVREELQKSQGRSSTR